MIQLNIVHLRIQMIYKSQKWDLMMNCLGTRKARIPTISFLCHPKFLITLSVCPSLNVKLRNYLIWTLIRTINQSIT